MYVLYQLVERSEFHADVLTKYRFWIIPVFNPDGYDYSMTFPHVSTYVNVYLHVLTSDHLTKLTFICACIMVDLDVYVYVIGYLIYLV